MDFIFYKPLLNSVKQALMHKIVSINRRQCLYLLSFIKYTKTVDY